MAITATHYRIYRSLREQGILPQGGALLELGEANWYNDADPALLKEDILQFVDGITTRCQLLSRLDDNPDLFDLAKVFYGALFQPGEMQAIDMHGTLFAQNLDLNFPVVLDRKFNVIINNGTAEHVFNIGQVFCTIHNYSLPGALMIHDGPLMGWLDHGFYCPQPTLYFDMAAANGYEIVCMFVTCLDSLDATQITSREQLHTLAQSGEVPENAMLFTVMRRGFYDRPFKVPMQGYYAGELSDQAKENWRTLR